MHLCSRERGSEVGKCNKCSCVCWAQGLQAVSVLIKGGLGVAEQVSGLIRVNTVKV